MNPELIELLSKLMSGLNVPGSMGVLGAADEPWKLLRNRWCLFGYQSPEEIADCIRRHEPHAS